MTAGGWVLIVVFVAGLAFYLAWQLKPDRSAAAVAEEQRRCARLLLEEKERLEVKVRMAATANYRSGLRDGTVEVCDRALGRRRPGEEDIGAVYEGNVPGPLRRWLEDVKARAEEHV